MNSPSSTSTSAPGAPRLTTVPLPEEDHFTYVGIDPRLSIYQPLYHDFSIPLRMLVSKDDPQIQWLRSLAATEPHGQPFCVVVHQLRGFTGPIHVPRLSGFRSVWTILRFIHKALQRKARPRLLKREENAGAGTYFTQRLTRISDPTERRIEEQRGIRNVDVLQGQYIFAGLVECGNMDLPNCWELHLRRPPEGGILESHQSK